MWVIGMRYKIINAETTEQLAQGYTEEKMEVGATSSGALGANESQQGGAGLDTMVQRLIQKSVWEIDSSISIRGKALRGLRDQRSLVAGARGTAEARHLARFARRS